MDVHQHPGSHERKGVQQEVAHVRAGLHHVSGVDEEDVVCHEVADELCGIDLLDRLLEQIAAGVVPGRSLNLSRSVTWLDAPDLQVWHGPLSRISITAVEQPEPTSPAKLWRKVPDHGLEHGRIRRPEHGVSFSCPPPLLRDNQVGSAEKVDLALLIEVDTGRDSTTGDGSVDVRFGVEGGVVVTGGNVWGSAHGGTDGRQSAYEVRLGNVAPSCRPRIAPSVMSAVSLAANWRTCGTVRQI